MQCDFRELAARSRNNAVAFIVIVLLLFPSSPSVLCVSPGNHVAFEDINALCYMSSGISDLSGRQPDTGFNGSGSCKNCTDFFLMSNGPGILSQSRKLAPTSSLADECLGTCLSAAISVSLCRSGIIGNIDTPISVYSSIPLRC